MRLSRILRKSLTNCVKSMTCSKVIAGMNSHRFEDTGPYLPAQIIDGSARVDVKTLSMVLRFGVD